MMPSQGKMIPPVTLLKKSPFIPKGPTSWKELFFLVCLLL